MGSAQSRDKTFMPCLKILERGLWMMRLRVSWMRLTLRVKGSLLTLIFVLLRILLKYNKISKI